jgi:hypothetical protein
MQESQLGPLRHSQADVFSWSVMLCWFDFEFFRVSGCMPSWLGLYGSFVGVDR